MQVMIGPRALTCALGGALAAVALACAPAFAAAPPRASLTKISCRSTLDPGLRDVSVVSVMRHIPGTRTLSVRFRLLETQPGQASRSVAGGDLGRWLAPADPTLGRAPDDVWRLAKSVYDVDAPAGYRFAVDFRWEGPGGRVLARSSVRSAGCAVRELRPDVLVRSVTVVAIPGHPTHERYRATIANRGATASGPFTVLFAPGAGVASQSQPIASLRAHSHRLVSFTGPACDPADPPTVVADPTDQVDDYDRADNTLTVTCPSG